MRRLALLVGLVASIPAARADLLDDAAAQRGEIETIVRSVFLHRVEENREALDAEVKQLDALDERRNDLGLGKTGLADDVRYLAAGLAVSRDARREALDDVLDHHPDPAVRRLVEYTLESDDAAAADRLLADDAHNRRAALVNDFVRPLGVFSGTALLAALNPFLLAGSALDSLGTTAINLWNYDKLSTPEREALARYRSELAREPRTEDAPEIARAIRRIGKKRTKALCEDTVRLGTEALDAGDLDRARFLLTEAGGMDDCDERAKKPLARTDEALAKRAAAAEAARWPVDDPPKLHPDEASDWEALATATIAAEPGGMTEAANRFLTRHDDSDYAPGARYVVAVARHLGGHETEARAALADLADDDSAAGRHAAAVLESPDFSRLDAIAAAERAHTRDTLRYVFLGSGWDSRSVVQGAAHLGSQGVHAAESFGIFNVLGVLTRAWQTWRRDPVSNQTILDQGEEFLARTPHAPEADDVRRRLADAYEREEAYGRAIMHLRALPDPDEKRIAKLEGKVGDQLLRVAERHQDDPVILEGLVRHFPDTKAADKAKKKLEGRPPAGTVLARDVLEAHPALLGPGALDLEPALLDGERSNGELADAGVTLADGEMKLTVHDGAGDERVEERYLLADDYARARAAAQEVLYANLLTTEHRDPDEGRFERYIPFYLQGSLGESGVAVAPGVKMRRYRSEERPLYE